MLQVLGRTCPSIGFVPRPGAGAVSGNMPPAGHEDAARRLIAAGADVNLLTLPMTVVPCSRYFGVGVASRANRDEKDDGEYPIITTPE